MNPGIWRNLPLEMLCTVVSSCDRSTLINWSCTSEFFYNLSSDLLWETLRVTGDELIDNTIWGRITRRRHGFPRIQRQMAKRPVSRVRDVRFNFNNHSVLEQAMYRDLSAHMMQSVLHMMPQLRRCHVEGDVTDKTWELVMEKTSLRYLQIRRQGEYVEPFSGTLGGIEWAQSQILNLQHVAGLVQLNSLSIGRLAIKEARALAQAVVSLPNLSALSISAGAPPRDATDVRSVFAETDDGESPIFEFLASVLQSWSQPAETSIPPLARTLKRLRFRDFYRSGPGGSSRRNSVLVDTVQHCQNLTILEICLLRPSALQAFFSQAELPALMDFAVLGCHHFFSEEGWANMGGVRVRKTEHHTSNEFASLFDEFLRSHTKPLSSVTLNRPIWSAKSRRSAELRFRRKDLDRFWSSTGPEIQIKYRNWQRGHWDTCSLDKTKGSCFENGERRRLTLWALEERDRRLKATEGNTGGR